MRGGVIIIHLCCIRLSIYVGCQKCYWNALRLELQHAIAATYWLSAYYVRTTYGLNEQATAAGSIESKCWLIFGDWGRRTYNAASMLCVFVFRRNPSVSHGISVNQDWIQPLRTFSPVKSTATYEVCLCACCVSWVSHFFRCHAAY